MPLPGSILKGLGEGQKLLLHPRRLARKRRARRLTQPKAFLSHFRPTWVEQAFSQIAVSKVIRDMKGLNGLG
jgi:hypothetical protein